MTESEIQFNFKARYFTMGSPSSASQCWFVLHGQGQLAQYFIKKFECLEALGVVIVAPEGLSRYYLNGFNGRVGATWMTKENRLTDIDNYLNYLNSVYETVNIPANMKTTIVGFSQGAATACRWVTDGKIKFDKLILWGGVFPPDMNFEIGHNLLKQKKVISVNGSQDPFMTEEKFKEMRNLSERLGITPTEIHFDGGHDIDKDILLRLFTDYV
jgi:predicted esterase